MQVAALTIKQQHRWNGRTKSGKEYTKARKRQQQENEENYIMRGIKSKILRRIRHVAHRKEIRNAHKIFVLQPKNVT
jgi:hypothetical protein